MLLFDPFLSSAADAATILIEFIAALTRFPELLLYAYPWTMMTTSSDLETVDVSRILSQQLISDRKQSVTPPLIWVCHMT